MYRTLVLNKEAYAPHEIVDWKDAVTRMFAGRLEVLVQYDEVLTTIGRNHLATFPELQVALRQVLGADAESFTIKVPAVAVLRRKVRRVKTGVKFSKVNVAARDKFSCQYCGMTLPLSKLNKDHVIPRAQWKSVHTPTTWDNVVTSCFPCNTYKADRTPEQAGMRLLSVPKRPKQLPMTGPYIDPSRAPVEWLPFITAA